VRGGGERGSQAHNNVAASRSGGTRPSASHASVTHVAASRSVGGGHPSGGGGGHPSGGGGGGGHAGGGHK
jgi:hypothetical protein